MDESDYTSKLTEDLEQNRADRAVAMLIYYMISSDGLAVAAHALASTLSTVIAQSELNGELRNPYEEVIDELAEAIKGDAKATMEAYHARNTPGGGDLN